MKTWQQIINDALDLLGISGTTAPPSEPDILKVQTLLRTIMSSLEAKGIELGAFLCDDNLNLNDNSNLPEQQELAIISRLAIFSSSIFQVTPTNELRKLAKETYLNLFSVLPPIKQQNPFQPTGQGDRFYNEQPKFMVNRYNRYRNDHLDNE